MTIRIPHVYRTNVSDPSSEEMRSRSQLQRRLALVSKLGPGCIILYQFSTRKRYLSTLESGALSLFFSRLIIEAFNLEM